MSVCLSVNPSFRMEQWFYEADFHEIWYLSVFRKSSEKIKEWRVLHMKANIPYTFYHFSLNYPWNEKYSRKRCRDNQKTHFTFNNFLPKMVPFMR